MEQKKKNRGLKITYKPPPHNIKRNCKKQNVDIYIYIYIYIYIKR